MDPHCWKAWDHWENGTVIIAVECRSLRDIIGPRGLLLLMSCRVCIALYGPRLSSKWFLIAFLVGGFWMLLGCSGGFSSRFGKHPRNFQHANASDLVLEPPTLDSQLISTAWRPTPDQAVGSGLMRQVRCMTHHPKEKLIKRRTAKRQSNTKVYQDLY